MPLMVVLADAVVDQSLTAMWAVSVVFRCDLG
jgi:hypothetical protein